jgi:hypothetical protein
MLPFARHATQGIIQDRPLTNNMARPTFHGLLSCFRRQRQREACCTPVPFNIPSTIPSAIPSAVPSAVRVPTTAALHEIPCRHCSVPLRGPPAACCSRSLVADLQSAIWPRLSNSSTRPSQGPVRRTPSSTAAAREGPWATLVVLSRLLPTSPYP